MNKTNKEQLAQEYIKKNTWRRFLKYKVYELGIIPLSALALWKIPLWIGLAVISIFGINPATNAFICKDINPIPLSGTICDGISYPNIWFSGFLILGVLSLFVGINYGIAHKQVKDEADKKYDTRTWLY